VAFYRGEVAATLDLGRIGVETYDVNRHRHLGHAFGGHDPGVCDQRANPRLSYESAYSRMYTHPENAGLRAEINREHLAASMAAVHG
jgi:hypothetical protein